jgi:hypothetical protein
MPALALALLLVEAAFQTGTPAGGVRVSGRVIDAAAAPVAGAQVTLQREDPPAEAGAPAPRATTTDAAGRFAFLPVEPGRYRVTARTASGVSAMRRVDTGAGAVADVSLILDDRAALHTEITVVVSAAAGAGPRVGGSLDAGALREMRTVASDDPMRAMQTLPGAATGDDFQSLFSMRGSAFRHLGMVVDGVPAAQLLHAVHAVEQPASIAMINTETLRRASVLAGPRPLADGEWLGPLLTFEVRDGARDTVRWSGLISGTAASIIAEGPLGGRGSWLVSLRRSYLDWLIRTLEPEFDSTVGFFDGTAKFSLDLTATQRLEVLAIGGDARYREGDVAAASSNRLARGASGSTVGAVSWRRTSARWTGSARAAFAGNDFRNTGGAGQELARGYAQTLLWRADAAAVLGRGWTADGGLLHARSRMNEILRDFRRTRAGALRVRAARDISPRTRLTSAWVQASRRSAAAGLTAGLRLSDRTHSSRRVVLPWLVVERRIGAVVWSAAAGAAAQYPDPRLVHPAEVASAPERARGLDTGLRGATKGLHWQVTGFQRRETDMLRPVGEPRLDPALGPHLPEGFPEFAGTLLGSSRGIEVALSHRTGGAVDGWIGYTWARTRMRDVRSDETFDGDFDQRHTFNAVAQYRLGTAWTAGASLRLGSNFPVAGYVEPHGDRLFLAAVRNHARLPMYARLDVRASRTFTLDRGRMTMFVEVLNVLGRRNLGQAGTALRPELEIGRVAERLIPRVPSAGLLIAF